MYDVKAIYEATSVPHAISLLQEHPEAKIIAGGSDVLIKIREGRMAGCELVSIYKLNELRGVKLDADGTLRILPVTSFSHITKDPLIQKIIPVLGEAVDKVGGPQIRNIGTIGGNISNGVTSADSASTLHAWDAVVELTGPDGVRQLPIKEYYVSAGKVALQPAELLTAILIKKQSYEGYFGHYIKYAMRNAMDIATTGCSVNVKLSADKKTLEDVRIAFGVAGPVPMRAPMGEAAGRGKAVCTETVEAVAKAVLEDVNPRTSWRASKEFRLQLAEELTRRALVESIRLAGGVIA
ncbi:MAG: xanthine dehydrogenase FAD-binding subunit XdhB [Eubacteriales bacterium]|nr:xanthine dehydrogenase FAD-binding subunit XdhB [Eubacteriales bacterium]